MADAKLSALTAIVSGDIDRAADYLYIIDTSEAASGMRKVLPNELFKDPVIGGVAYFADGSAAAPAIVPSSDTDTGLYFGAAAEVDVAIAGTKLAAFTATTLDAIGTTLRVLNSNGTVGGFQVIAGGIGLDNLVIGHTAGAALNAGVSNILLGQAAGKSLTDANYTVAIGKESCELLTTGHGNIAIGYQCLETGTDGTYNVAIGYQCMDDGTTGNDKNVAIGYAVMSSASMTGADNNVGIGSAAAYALTTGDGNVLIGQAAATGLTTGSNNVCIGVDAGRYYGAGADVLTDPENSIYIGRLARGLGNTDTTCIVIGDNVVGLGANTCVIGASSQTTFLAYGAHRLSNVAAPTAVADNCFIYAADQAAGNSCPHILTEGNKTLKLFQGAAIADAGAGEAETQLNLLLAHLRLMGVIASA